jgi:hypothetical protein
MIGTLAARWFGRRRQARAQRSARDRRRVRPLLEALEDRLSPAVLVVNSDADNTTDTTVLTLRDALTLVNNGGAPTALGQSSMPAGWASQISGTFGSSDTIDFAIAKSGTQTIVLGSALPAITTTVTIDGTSEPGYAGQPLIVINANNSVANGLEVDGVLSGVSPTAVLKGLQITGATSAGIFLSLGGGSIVSGNWLTGNATGLFVSQSSNNTIGGTTAGSGNLISGNTGDGIDIEPEVVVATGNVVEGNWIGTDSSGTGANGNGADGVYVTGSGNTIGGQAGGAANIIAHNGNVGVEVGPTQGLLDSGTQDLISANSIHNNTAGGIQLVPGIPLGNNGQHAPSLASASITAGQVHIQGTLAAAASTRYTLEFFGDPVAAGTGAGQDYLGTTSVTTDTSGNASFTFTAPMPAADHTVTATATDPHNNTSAFSATPFAGTTVVTVNSAADNTTDTTVLTLRDALTLVGNGFDPSSLGQASMPAGWASQISGIIGNNIVIDFNIASSGTQTIVLTSDLPAIESALTIDATSEAGYAGQPLIVINANHVAQNGLALDAGATINGGTIEGLQIEGALNAGIALLDQRRGNSGGITVVHNWLTGNQNGIVIEGARNNTIGATAAGAANVISGNQGTGITLENNNAGLGGTGNLVEGNFIGTDPSGTSANGNGIGIEDFVGAIGSTGNIIGGTTPPSASGGAGNLISGNNGTGIQVIDDNLLVEGNYIGMQLDGLHVLSNGGNGIVLGGSLPGTIIGGTASGAGNLISGNLGSGIILGTSGAVIEGNFIGTDRSGTSILAPSGTPTGNQRHGIDVEFGGNTIGGTASGAANVIAGSGLDGIFRAASGGGGNLVEGNFIGTDAAGDNLGNASNGVDLTGSGEIIGGQASGAGNVIAFNGKDGILVHSTGNTATQDLISGNSIHNNATLGIELTNGGNNGQAAPAIASVSPNGSQEQIQGTMTAAANTTYVIEFFADPAADPSGAGEGQDFLGSTTVTTGAGGSAPFTFTTTVPSGDHIVTATATDPQNNTSAFSLPAVIEVPVSIVTQPASQTVDVGGLATFNAAASGVAAPTVQWQISTDGGNTFHDYTGAGATSVPLSFVAAAADDGDQFQAVFSNELGSVTTTAVTLTVNSPPIHIGMQPGNLTVNVGATVTLHAAATSSPAPSVQWQKSINGGNTWSNITGATGATLTLPKATLAWDESEYRAVFAAKISGNTVHATTTAAVLTVDQPPIITRPTAIQPTGTINAGIAVTFSATASGKPAPAVQWQVKQPGAVTFTNIAGATNGTVTFTATATKNGDQFRTVFTNSVGTVTTKPVTLVVNFAPIVRTQPVSKTAAPKTAVTFTAAATANPAISKIQWQASSDGGQTWNPLTGQTAATLTLNATAALNGNQYRVVFTNSLGSTTSSAATLIVNTAPVVTANPLTQEALVGQTVTFTAAATVVSGSPGATVQWQVSTDFGHTWTNLSGKTHTALTVTAAASLDEDEYRAIFSNSGGSTATQVATLFVF